MFTIWQKLELLEWDKKQHSFKSQPWYRHLKDQTCPLTAKLFLIVLFTWRIFFPNLHSHSRQHSFHLFSGFPPSVGFDTPLSLLGGSCGHYWSFKGEWMEMRLVLLLGGFLHLSTRNSNFHLVPWFYTVSPSSQASETLKRKLGH